MKIGVIELLAAGSSPNWRQTLEAFLTTKQYASIMPQAVAVWARQLGHEVHYATFYGPGDPKRKLPADLDFVFMSVYTVGNQQKWDTFVKERSGGNGGVLGLP